MGVCIEEFSLELPLAPTTVLAPHSPPILVFFPTRPNAIFESSLPSGVDFLGFRLVGKQHRCPPPTLSSAPVPLF